MRPLVIIGTGGHGREALDIVDAVNRVDPTYDFLGFLDDRDANDAFLACRGAVRLGSPAQLQRLEAEYVVGIGSTAARRRLDALGRELGRTAAVLVHPAATVGSDVSIGPGVLLAAGARVTTHVTLGRHVHLNLNASISHDCAVGDYVTLSPGCAVSGNVVLEEGSYLGTGAVALPGVRVGAGTYVGAGAVVVDDLPAGVTAVGVPARPIGPRSEDLA